jgi:protein O-mannosyl-transferase
MSAVTQPTIPKFLPLILIPALGFILYGNTLHGTFLWDDEYLVQRNPYIRTFSQLTTLLTTDIGYGGGNRFGFYRPVQMLTYTLDYAFGGLNVFVYHLTNLLLHTTAALCVYHLAALLFGPGLVPLATSLLFMAHPVHVEAVAYISGRADPLALLFMLLAFIAYLRHPGRHSLLSSTLIVLAYSSALLSKELSLVLPALLLLYHYAFGHRIKWQPLSAVLALTCIFVVARLTVLKHIPPGNDALQADTTLLQRTPGFFAAMTSYARLLVAPFDLHMEYGTPLFTFSQPAVIAGILIFGSLVAFAAIAKKRNPPIFFCLMWFLITLLPVSNLYPLNAYMAEHWLYLPSLGIFMAVGYGLNRLWIRENKVLVGLGVVILASLTCFYSALTIRQNRRWEGPLPFYEWTRKFAPDSPKVLNDLGRQYDLRGRNEEAEELYRKAIRMQPTSPLPFNNLGFLYQKLERYEEAKAMYEKALELDPSYADALNNLGVLSEATGKYEEAVRLYDRAIAAYPGFALGYANLGNALVSVGNNDDAINAYQNALRLDGTLTGAQHNLGLLYARMGRKSEATLMFEQIVHREPANGPAQAALTMLYYETRDYAAAARHCDAALRLGFAVDPAIVEALRAHRR